jgi:hypothetical protein
MKKFEGITNIIFATPEEREKIMIDVIVGSVKPFITGVLSGIITSAGGESIDLLIAPDKILNILIDPEDKDTTLLDEENKPLKSMDLIKKIVVIAISFI